MGPLKRLVCKSCRKVYYDDSPYDYICVVCWNKKKKKKKYGK